VNAVVVASAMGYLQTARPRRLHGRGRRRSGRGRRGRRRLGPLRLCLVRLWRGRRATPLAAGSDRSGY
jgi:hypothetical protein